MKREYQKPLIRAVALCPNKFVAVSGSGSSENTDWQFGSQPVGGNGGDPEASRSIWGESIWDEE